MKCKARRVTRTQSGQWLLPDNKAFSTVANYAFGHLEIGTHRALIGLTDQAGDRDTRTFAEFILAQELETAA